MKISMRSLVSLSLLVTTACGPTGELPAEDAAPAASAPAERRPQEFSLVEAARHSLLLTDQAHSELTARLGLDGLTALFADDISYSDGDRLIRGRQAAREYLAANQYPAPAGYTMRWQTVRGDVSADGRDGYTFGWVTFSAADGSTWNIYGKYINYWRREALGWRIVGRLDVLTYSSPNPPPAWFQPITGGKPSLPPVDQESERAALVSTDAAFSALSVAQGQAVAFPAYSALEAVNIGGPMTYGRDAIAQRYAGVPITNVLSWTTESVDVSRGGDFGFTMGPWLWTSGETSYRGVYMTVWQKEGAAWKWIVDG